MIGMRQSRVIEKDAIATLPRSLLKRQGDQVAEAALGKRVLIGEETVIRIKPDARSAFHRFGQQVCAELARKRGRDRLLEKQPDVSPMARARPLQSRRQIQPTTSFQEVAAASSCHCALSRSAARKKQVSSRSNG